MSEAMPGSFEPISSEVDEVAVDDVAIDEAVVDNDPEPTHATTQEGTSPQAAELSPSVDDGTDSLDKIRGILFGEQSREYSHRINNLESKLELDTRQLKDELLARVAELEMHVGEQVQRLDKTDNEAQQSRRLLEQGLQQSIDALKQEMLQKIGQLDDRFNHELKQLDYKYQKLTLQMRQQHELFTKLLAQEVKQLQNNKVDRSELAGFLSDTALRLSRDGDG
ncbi:MAG: hypothetical protein AAF512_08080 [Pseudomonadota bacterium]